MKRILVLYSLLLCFSSCQQQQPTDKIKHASKIQTYCNPLDLNYRFGLDTPSRREAADPTVILFRDMYYLFASKSGGYWHSDDLVDWTFSERSDLPVEEYAPTVIDINDTLYFLASSGEHSRVYMTTDPLNGTWTVAVDSLEVAVWDPAFFMDDDNKLYLYWGCSNVNPIYGTEVDYKNGFKFLGETKELLRANTSKYGWEVPGDYNTLVERQPYIEGAWMNKIEGKYYLQYSGPGTEFKSYSDAVYVSENPLGPYNVATHNPFAYKPEGFATAAGHGSTFQDRYGNYWHVGTITISEKHMFERRLALFPAFYDQGTLYTVTRFGDYPHFLPQAKFSSFEDVFTGWMLLSYNKPVIVSSTLSSFGAENITDENLRSYWSASSGASGEFAQVDLLENYQVKAIQVNFAEHHTAIYGRDNVVSHRYKVFHSLDGNNWNILVDRSNSDTDNTHNYHELEQPLNTRYIKVINEQVPDGTFAISGVRVFGSGHGESPIKPDMVSATRASQNRRTVKISWDEMNDVVGYNIRFGSKKNQLFNHYTVYDRNSIDINVLNVDLPYYFAIEAFNENGVSPLSEAIVVE